LPQGQRGIWGSPAVVHLGDEGREENLRNPEKSDVQDGIQTCDPGGTREREGIGPNQSVGWVVTIVSVKRSFLDTGKDEEEKDSDSHTGSYKSITQTISKQARKVS
jgi:hypothetical protein